MNLKEEALKIYKEIEVRYQGHNLLPSFLAIAVGAISKDKYALDLAHHVVDVSDPYLSNIGIGLKTSKAMQKFRVLIEYIGVWVIRKIKLNEF